MVSNPQSQRPQEYSFYQEDGTSQHEVVRLRLSYLGVVRVKRKPVPPPLLRPDYRLILVQRGVYGCILNGEEMFLRRRDLLIVKPCDQYEENRTAGVRYVAIDFSLSGDGLFGADFLPVGSLPEDQVLRGTDVHIAHIVERMLAESLRASDLDEQIKTALLYQLFWHISRILHDAQLARGTPQRPAWRLFNDRLHSLFETHVSAKLTAPQMAAALGVSLRTLNNRCRKVIGHPPMIAFKRYKLTHAARELRQPGNRIKEVSYRLGFQNPSHFSRVFRRYLGEAPSRYRRAQDIR